MRDTSLHDVTWRCVSNKKLFCCEGVRQLRLLVGVVIWWSMLTSSSPGVLTNGYAISHILHTADINIMFRHDCY